MITEILLRTYTNVGKKYLETVATLIRQSTNMKVTLIDHTEIELSSFYHEDNETLISIDRYLAKRFNIPYYQISRVFNDEGEVISRLTKGEVPSYGNHIRIIDTDIVSGEAIARACAIFGTKNYSVPIVIEPHQDLIDIEDLSSMILDEDFDHENFVSYASIISRTYHGETFTIDTETFTDGKPFMDMGFYLENSKFFMNRTSLPFELYKPMCGIFGIQPAWKFNHVKPR